MAKKSLFVWPSGFYLFITLIYATRYVMKEKYLHELNNPTLTAERLIEVVKQRQGVFEWALFISSGFDKKEKVIFNEIINDLLLSEQLFRTASFDGPRIFCKTV